MGSLEPTGEKAGSSFTWLEGRANEEMKMPKVSPGEVPSTSFLLKPELLMAGIGSLCLHVVGAE